MSRSVVERSRRVFLMAGAAVLLAACSHGQVGGAPYSLGVRGAGNEITFKPDANGDLHDYFVTVKSPSGIGEATVAWWGTATPHHVTFHLHLSGLEHFRLTWAHQTVTVSVNSANNTVGQWVQIGDSGERELDSSSPYWLEVSSLAQTERGYLLHAPRAFIEGAPRLWAIAWVDYYR